MIFKSKNNNIGKLKDFKLVLHGTYEKPDYLKNGPRNYAETATETAQINDDSNTV